MKLRKVGHTTINFFKSFPAATSRRISKALLISNLRAPATPKTTSSGRKTSGYLGGDLIT